MKLNQQNPGFTIKNISKNAHIHHLSTAGQSTQTCTYQQNNQWQEKHSVQMSYLPWLFTFVVSAEDPEKQ